MRNDTDVLKIGIIKRRLVLIKSLYFFLLSILTLKLGKLQIFEGFFYRRRANNNYIRHDFLLPRRGDILDRNNTSIATTKFGYELVYYSLKDKNMEKVDEIYKILGRDYNKIKRVRDSIARKIAKYNRQKFVLAKNLSNAERVRMMFNMVYIRGMEIEEYYLRRYPFGMATSPVAGYVIGIANSNDKTARQNSHYRVGISGAEKALERKLGGTIGIRQNYINAIGVKVDSKITKKPFDGESITLTLDQRLQNFLAELMQDKSGACTLMDVETGEILAMHSTPNIDPNYLSMGVSDEEWEDINKEVEENSGIFLNKNISSAYPPGSTFKVISSLAALKSGFDPYKKFNCTGEYKIGDRVFHCWIAQTERKRHGLVDMNMALAQSCNCYFYHLSQQVDNDDLYEMAKKFGLGEKHMPDFDAEVAGLVPNKRWKKQKHNQIWMPGDNANMALGQGYLNLTPLQLAIMMARLATNKVVEPEYLFGKKRIFEDLGINEEHMNIVRRGLFSVINESYGIIYGMARKKYQICGKTGSAQVVSQRITNKDMREGLVAKEKHSHAWFVGFAPFDNPKYAVSVIVEHGIGGARSAAPIGTRLLANAMDLYKE